MRSKAIACCAWITARRTKRRARATSSRCAWPSGAGAGRSVRGVACAGTSAASAPIASWTSRKPARRSWKRTRAAWPAICVPSAAPTDASHVAVVEPAFARAAVVNRVGVEHVARRIRIALREPLVDRREVRARRFHQLLVAVDDEVRLLVGVDAVARAHDALEVEADAVRRRALQAMDRLALGTDDAAAVDAQPVGLPDQPEFHRVPVQAREVDQRLGPDAVRLHATA